ncbi:MAG: hypothetical protein DRP55_09995 [Spirochaetes bacterium]|nr:MAG: hypothetical protein DRP55_09995 [Spirochaetota bacterium]
MKQKKTQSLILAGIMLISFLTITPAVQATGPHAVKGTLYINNEIPNDPPYDFKEITVKLIFPSNATYDETIYEFDLYNDNTNYNIGFFGHEEETANIKVEYYGQIIIPNDNQTVTINTDAGYIIDLHITAPEIDTEPPTKVTGLTITDAKDGKLNLKWNTATDNIAIDHYNIYRDGTLLTTTTTTNYQDTGLTNGQTYCYQISATDTSGNEGEKSDQKCATPTKTTPSNNPPDKPINPNPENNSENVSTNPEISIYVTDPDNDTLTVHFFNASNDQPIRTVNNVENATNAKIIWSSLEHNTTYYWYVVVNDSEFETRSDIFNFKTVKEDKTPPEIYIKKPENGSLYIFGTKIFSGLLNHPFIIGSITIDINAKDDESSVSKVKLTIKNNWCKITENLTEHPYTYEWKSFGVGKYTITATAYDTNNNYASTIMTAYKFL